MQLSDPRHAAVMERLDASAPAVISAVEAAHRARIARHDAFITAMDTLAEKFAEVRIQQIRQYNGLSNHAAQTEMEYTAMRQELIHRYAHDHNLEVRF